MIVVAALTVGLLTGLLVLVPLGLRNGDEVGDTLVLDVEPDASPRGARATVSNPAPEPVLVGLGLRRPGLRLRLEAGAYVKVRTARISPELLAGRQAVLGVVLPRGASTFVVPAGPGLGRTAELVVVVGQSGRLRTIHRAVRLPAPAPRLRPSFARRSVRVEP